MKQWRVSIRPLDAVPSCAVAASSSFEAATEFGYLLSQFVGLVSGDKHQLVIHDSVVGCVCIGHGDGVVRRTLRNCGRFSRTV
mgnify:CR=1 FL=1